MDCCCAVSISKYRCYRRCSGSTDYWALLKILEDSFQQHRSEYHKSRIIMFSPHCVSMQYFIVRLSDVLQLLNVLVKIHPISCLVSSGGQHLSTHFLFPYSRYVSSHNNYSDFATLIPRGGPKIRWEDDIRKDLQTIRIKNWKKSVLDRNSWNTIVERRLRRKILYNVMYTHHGILC
jgi:hypothetical protein